MRCRFPESRIRLRHKSMRNLYFNAFEKSEKSTQLRNLTAQDSTVTRPNLPFPQASYIYPHIFCQEFISFHFGSAKTDPPGHPCFLISTSVVT